MSNLSWEGEKAIKQDIGEFPLLLARGHFLQTGGPLAKCPPASAHRPMIPYGSNSSQDNSLLKSKMPGLHIIIFIFPSWLFLFFFFLLYLDQCF